MGPRRGIQDGGGWAGGLRRWEGWEVRVGRDRREELIVVEGEGDGLGRRWGFGV